MQKSNEKYAVIRVADNGSGIPNDMKSHILKCFILEKVQLPTAAEALDRSYLMQIDRRTARRNADA